MRYWAVDTDGRRADELACVEQGRDGGFARVFTSDPRPVELALELRDAGSWREVRVQRVPGGAPRILPGPYERA